VDDRATLEIIGVRRWGEEDATPIAIDTRAACGTWSDHYRNGCIGIETRSGRGGSGLMHLTTTDALRLSDLLRALATAEGDRIAMNPPLERITPPAAP
jgi:hypothetical protein